MNKQTVYIPIEITEEFWKKFDSGEIPDYEIISCSNGERLDEWVDSKEGYFFTPEELKPLQDIVDEGYDPYDSAHHLVVQRWLKIIKNFLNKEK